MIDGGNEIRLVPVRLRDRTLLWNLFQKFLYEMTNFYDNEFDEEGNLHYGHFDSYFEGKPDRRALFLYENETMVGFAMLNRFSHIGAELDWALAEFTVFPRFRRHHLALQATRKLFKEYPGRWEIKYNEKNQAAKALWNKVTADNNPQTTRLNEFETVLDFMVQKG
ncbi:MAG: GNAT family N-acetyltransferase [Clostridia bacterium]|nr:GNAT family N-acetyltransferase [Clostridia bacterium]MBQ9409057.1 GNAT family N-acetyltransferase [Clostridia bacterium]